jgi:hypothetical protein
MRLSRFTINSLRVQRMRANPACVSKSAWHQKRPQGPTIFIHLGAAFIHTKQIYSMRSIEERAISPGKSVLVEHKLNRAE